MSFLLDLPVSRRATVAICVLPGKTPCCEEQFIVRIKGFTRLPALSFLSFGWTVSTPIVFLILLCPKSFFRNLKCSFVENDTFKIVGKSFSNFHYIWMILI